MNHSKSAKKQNYYHHIIKSWTRQNYLVSRLLPIILYSYLNAWSTFMNSLQHRSSIVRFRGLHRRKMYSLSVKYHESELLHWQDQANLILKIKQRRLYIKWINHELEVSDRTYLLCKQITDRNYFFMSSSIIQQMPMFTFPAVRQNFITSCKLVAILRANIQVMSYLIGLRCIKTETYYTQPALIFAQTKNESFFLYMIGRHSNLLPHGSVVLEFVCWSRGQVSNVQ